MECRANLGVLSPSLAVESEGLFRGVKQSVVEEVGTDHYTCSSLQRDDRHNWSGRRSALDDLLHTFSSTSGKREGGESGEERVGSRGGRG